MKDFELLLLKKSLEKITPVKDKKMSLFGEHLKSHGNFQRASFQFIPTPESCKNIKSFETYYFHKNNYTLSVSHGTNTAAGSKISFFAQNHLFCHERQKNHLKLIS